MEAGEGGNKGERGNKKGNNNGTRAKPRGGLKKEKRPGNTRRVSIGNTSVHGFNINSPPPNVTHENKNNIRLRILARQSKKWAHPGNEKGYYKFTKEKPVVHPGSVKLPPRFETLFAGLHEGSDSREEFVAKLNRRLQSPLKGYHLTLDEAKILLAKFNALYPQGITNTHVNLNLLEMSGEDLLDLSEAEFNRLASKLTKEELKIVTEKIFAA